MIPTNSVSPNRAFKTNHKHSHHVVVVSKQSVDSSFAAATVKTADLSFSSASLADTSSSMMNLSTVSSTEIIHGHDNHRINSNSTGNSNSRANKTGVSLLLSNELLADALEQLTELAMATGIVASNPNHEQKVMSTTTTTTDELLIENEEPGRIYSSATCSNSSIGSGIGHGGVEPDYTNKEEVNGRPFDEGPVVKVKSTTLGPFRSEEELSAIVRMRYYKAVGKELPVGGVETVSGKNKNKKEEEEKNGHVQSDHQDIQRETIDRWKSLQEKASKEEGDRLKLFATGVGEKHGSNGKVNKSKYQKKIKHKRRSKQDSSTTASGSQSEGDGCSLEDGGLFDFSFLTRSLEEAWNHSQATIMEAVVGDREEEDDDSCTSCSSFSEYDDDDDEEEEDGSYSPSDSSKEFKRKNQRQKSKNVYYDDDDDNKEDHDHHDDTVDSDDMDDVDNHDGQGGSASNRNFLEDITDSGIILVWHRPRSSTSAKLFKKVRLNIQISDTEDGKVEPNLVWEALEDRRREYQLPNRDKISLFDISLIEKASDSLNLNAFPHAVADHSILITLNDGKVCLFEARDLDQAREIIHGLRWITARLTFNIIIGNFNICTEMLSIKDQVSVSDYTKDMFQNVTNQLVEKTLIKL